MPYFNTLAFVALMIEICVHLPYGIGYALHLVLPLLICYTFCNDFWAYLVQNWVDSTENEGRSSAKEA